MKFEVEVSASITLEIEGEDETEVYQKVMESRDVGEKLLENATCTMEVIEDE